MANLVSNGLPYMSLPLQNLPNLPTEIPLKVRPLSSSDNGWSTVEYQRQALGGPYQDGALSYPEQTLHGRMFSDSSDSSQDPRVGKQQLLQITEQGQQGNPQFQTNQERFRPSDELMRRTRMHSNPNTIKSNETHNIAAPASYAQIQANSAAKIPSPQSTTRHSALILNAGSPPNFYSPLAYDYDGHEGPPTKQPRLQQQDFAPSVAFQQKSKNDGHEISERSTVNKIDELLAQWTTLESAQIHG